MNNAKSIFLIVVSWLILIILTFVYSLIFQHADGMTLFVTCLALMPFVSIIAFIVSCIVYRKTIRKDIWFCLIVYLVLIAWAIYFLNIFFLVHDGEKLIFRWLLQRSNLVAFRLAIIVSQPEIQHSNNKYKGRLQEQSLIAICMLDLPSKRQK